MKLKADGVYILFALEWAERKSFLLHAEFFRYRWRTLIVKKLLYFDMRNMRF